MGKNKDKADKHKEAVQCAVCLEDVHKKTVLDGCPHEYCWRCISAWSNVSNTCPKCKNSFTTLTRVSSKGKLKRTVEVKEKKQRSDFDEAEAEAAAREFAEEEEDEGAEAYLFDEASEGEEDSEDSNYWSEGERERRKEEVKRWAGDLHNEHERFRSPSSELSSGAEDDARDIQAIYNMEQYESDSFLVSDDDEIIQETASWDELPSEQSQSDVEEDKLNSSDNDGSDIEEVEARTPRTRRRLTRGKSNGNGIASTHTKPRRLRRGKSPPSIISLSGDDSDDDGSKDDLVLFDNVDDTTKGKKKNNSHAEENAKPSTARRNKRLICDESEDNASREEEEKKEGAEAAERSNKECDSDDTKLKKRKKDKKDKKQKNKKKQSKKSKSKRTAEEDAVEPRAKRPKRG